MGGDPGSGRVGVFYQWVCACVLVARLMDGAGGLHVPHSVMMPGPEMIFHGGDRKSRGGKMGWDMNQ